MLQFLAYNVHTFKFHQREYTLTESVILLLLVAANEDEVQARVWFVLNIFYVIEIVIKIDLMTCRLHFFIKHK